MSRKIVIKGQMDNTIDHTFESANRVHDKRGLCPTIPTACGGGHTPKVIKRKGTLWKKKKTLDDYLYEASDGELYGIFKLSPRECLRLMGVRDSDIDKMLAVNSNSQCYKQAGNSICVPVLMAIFSQLHIKGVGVWNEMTDEEKAELIERTTR